LPPIFAQPRGEPPVPRCNTMREEYLQMVRDSHEYIHAGDIFQIVPSQRFETDYTGDPLTLYRTLRFVNPSPYMFCLKLGERFALVGSSPEVHVRAINGRVQIRPIAGTKRRGATSEEDEQNAQTLLADPKERAEHLMLVDLARNDVGRIANYATVEVTDFMTIEKYSHVMHIVSNVTGQLREDRNAYDVMRATFPAGTVSGSPKVRAMQIINQLEKSKRGVYAGAVGYFGFDGNSDSCIALRTVVLKDGVAYVQAGAGVVADSTPEGEYQECVNKAMGMMAAIGKARSI
jgi:anthranilate synthase component 1